LAGCSSELSSSEVGVLERTRPNIVGVEDAVVAVTYRCNSRCSMCGIWRFRGTEQEMRPEEYDRLPATLKDINISGGEPFLRDDLVDVVRRVADRCRSAKLIISTNGLEPDRVDDAIRDLRSLYPRLGVGVSIDGVGSLHDDIRGVTGAFEKATATVERLKQAGLENIRVGMTIGQDNLSQIKATYDLSRSLGVEFTCSLAQNSDHYFMTQDNKGVTPESLRQELDALIRAELRTFSPKRWFRAYFDRGIYWQATDRGRLLGCGAGVQSFFLDPFGNVYPCNILDQVMGNLLETSFEELWTSEHAEDVRRQTGMCEAKCWMVCTARTAIRRNLTSAVGWILRSKMDAHLGRRVLRA